MYVRSLAVAVAILVLVTGACFAQAKCPPGPEFKLWGGLESKPKTAQDYKPDKVEIGIGSYKLLDLRTGAAGYSLAEREVAVYNRLAEALSIGPVKADMICIGKVRSAPTIYVGRVRFISVYPQDAAAAGKSQVALAQAWRNRLAEVIPAITALTGVPGLTGVVRGTYEVAVGGTLLFRLRGKDGFESLKARGLSVEGHVVNMLSDGRYKPTVARAAAAGGSWVVMFGALHVVTATAEDAAANKATPEQLAQAWAAKLNTILDKVKGPTQQ